MIVCPNCNHQNPDGAVQCEACYTPLPAITACPNCGASVQTDASFCGQCGFNLKAAAVAQVAVAMSPSLDEASISVLVQPDPLVEPDPIPESPGLENPVAVSVPMTPEPPPDLEIAQPASLPDASLATPIPAPSVVAVPSAIEGRTQLQTQSARLLHVQTNTSVELPPGLTVIHIGKPNDRIPPDIDVSGFPNSEIVSRIHADIRLEGDAYYIEDVGSSNGTYINNLPLVRGNRHRLRPGDRIALGKGDKVTFLFQLS
ncbi:FHA domain-containing protein [Leptolyngbyaceae cyanobacterium JSC-12]|nr:FHA domain-containing protein [Leptolyngbyaceae cyanobacterium JSC-12]